VPSSLGGKGREGSPTYQSSDGAGEGGTHLLVDIEKELTRLRASGSPWTAKTLEELEQIVTELRAEMQAIRKTGLNAPS